MLHNNLLNLRSAQRVSGAGDYTDIHSTWHITLVMAGYRCGVCL